MGKPEQRSKNASDQRCKTETASGLRSFWPVFALVVASFTLAASGAPLQHVPGQILVRVKDGAAPKILSKHLASPASATTRVLKHRNIRVLKVADEQVETLLANLRNDPDVEFAERDFVAQAAALPNDTYAVTGEEWHIARLQLPAAWDVTTGNQNVIVAVLDSGVNSAHPDLAGQLLPGQNFVYGGTDVTDDFGHGTAVAGTIAAVGNNGVGVAGVAFGCRVLPLKVMDFSGFATYSDIAEGIQYAVDQGARVINLSIAGDSPSVTLQSAIDYAWSNNVVVVAAAGNNANSVPQYPAACNHVVAVAATDEGDMLASFSSFGSYVTLCAPGVDIWTTQRNPANPYGAWRGTSFASPMVAGVAALVISVNSALTADQIAEVLKQTADDLGPAGYDEVYANGRVNALKAVAAASALPGASAPPVVVPPSVSLDTPTNPAQINFSESVTLSASASANANGSSIVSVDFFANGTRLMSLAPAPYQFDWTPPQAGVYSLVAVATDNQGARGTSAPVSLTVAALEAIPPTLTVKSAPKNGARLGTPALALAGTANDNEQLDRVEASLNGAPFEPVTGAVNWSVFFTLTPGKNSIQLRSVDHAGNYSVVTRLTYTYVKLAPLSVQTNGFGLVTPNLDGRQLEIGRTYTMKAVPAKDQLFVGWTGVNSSSANLSFVMQEGLALTANFILSPFLPLKGTFNGLVANTNEVTPANSGAFSVSVTSLGSFTGNLRLGGARYGFHGRFDLNGDATVSIARELASPLTMALHLDMTGESQRVTGNLTDGGWASAMSANRSVFNALANPAPQAGQGQFVLQQLGAVTNAPAANGSSRIQANGSTLMAGRLLDGRKFTASNSLARNGDFPFYLSLSRGQEVVLGWVNFPNAALANGAVQWVKTGTNGFAATLQAAAAK